MADAITSLTLPAVQQSEVQTVLERLPPLPSAVRYFDDFQDNYRSIRDLATQDSWNVKHDGRTTVLRFGRFGPAHSHLLKHVFVEWLSRLDATTVTIRFEDLRRTLESFGIRLFDCLVTRPPHELRQLWISDIRPSVSAGQASSLRAFLRCCCNLNVGHWNPGLGTFLSQLPSPKMDIYKTVRTGDSFLPVDQQSLVVDYFDEMATVIATSPERIDTADLRSACALLVIYQHAFRPGQVARIKTSDVRVFNTGAFHFSVLVVKQRDQQKRRLVSRRVKREWCPILIEYQRRRNQGIALQEGVPGDSFFGLIPDEVGTCVRDLLNRITEDEWSSRDLRHSAAQRLVDSGAAHIVVSEFMTHSDLKTALVYFDSSPTQAQRVNQALGLSPIYATVAEVAKTRTIDKAALLQIDPDKQIGGVPHGIPIAGIGACTAGQSVCSKIPVTSCYTCRKFMPVKDQAIHREVTSGLRSVVMEFVDASRGNEESPAYTQLRRTIEAAERVITDIQAQQVAENE